MARLLNGSSDAITLVDSSTLSPGTGDFSLSCIATPSTVDATNHFLYLDYDAAGNAQVLLHISTGDKWRANFRNTDGSTEATAVGATTVVAGTEYRLCVVRSGTTVYLYVNGVQDGSGTNASLSNVATSDGEPPQIGRYFFGGTSAALWFHGSIAEFGIWNAALSVAEVVSLAKGASPLLIRPVSGAGYWPLMGKNSPEPDLIGRNTGTLVGTSAVAHPRMIYPRWVEAIHVPVASGNVTVALTGVAATCAIGVLSAALSLGLSGATGTGAAGSVSPSSAVAVSGVAGTGAAGSLIPSTTLVLTGATGTGSVGTLTPASTLPITGTTGTGAAGTLTPSTTLVLTGASATGAVGTVTASGGDAGNVNVALTGVSATGAVGSVTPSSTLALSGTAATGSSGTLSPGASLAVSGVAGTGSVGTLTPSRTVALTGTAATGAVGTVTPTVAVTAALTGVSASGGVGSLVQSRTVPLSGSTATGAVGTVTASGGLPGAMRMFFVDETLTSAVFTDETLGASTFSDSTLL